MDGSQYDAIERRARVIEKVLLRDTSRIASKLALGALVKMPDNCHGEEVWEKEALVYIKNEVDKIIQKRQMDR